ncbi:MAG: universal stress protein [Thaumarchaeota archaeon]|nr:universal stress protein [Nitrososphaerota archaeon]
MFAKILVAVDGSESSKKAFAKSVFLAQKCNSKLYVVNVVLDWEYGGDSAATFELKRLERLERSIEYKPSEIL